MTTIVESSALRTSGEAVETHPETGPAPPAVTEALAAYVAWYREGLRIARWNMAWALAGAKAPLVLRTADAATNLHDRYRDDVTNALMLSIRDWAEKLEPPCNLKPPEAPPPNVRPRYSASCTVCHAALHVSYETEVRAKGWRTLAVHRPYRSSRNPIHAWICAECLLRIAELHLDHATLTPDERLLLAGTAPMPEADLDDVDVDAEPSSAERIGT